MIRRICMHCGDVMGYREGGEGDSHGVCDPCYMHHYPEIWMRKRRKEITTESMAKRKARYPWEVS